MKKINISISVFYSLTISSLLLLSLQSCQPKDITLNSKLNSNNNSLVTQLNVTESDKLLSLSMDRQSESMHLIKALLNSKYAESNGLVLQNEILSTNNQYVMMENSNISNQYIVNYEVKNLIKDSQGKLVSVVLKNLSGIVLESKGVLKGTKPTDFSSKAMSEYISVQKINESEFLVQIDRIDETNSKNDKQTFMDLNLAYSLIWDGSTEALDSELGLKLLSLTVERKGNKTGLIKYDKIESDLKIKLAECISVNGKITLSQSDEIIKSKMTLPQTSITNISILDSTISIPDRGFTGKTQACESRPVVDLTKML